MLAVFTPLLPDDVNPSVALHYLETRAGLLIGRREGVYAFPYRSFQEYLAGLPRWKLVVSARPRS